MLQTQLNEKQMFFKRWMTIQLYPQTNFRGQLTMTLHNKSSHFSSFSSGFRKLLSRSDVELPTQAENDRVEQFKYYI